MYVVHALFAYLIELKRVFKSFHWMVVLTSLLEYLIMIIERIHTVHVHTRVHILMLLLLFYSMQKFHHRRIHEKEYIRTTDCG